MISFISVYSNCDVTTHRWLERWQLQLEMDNYEIPNENITIYTNPYKTAKVTKKTNPKNLIIQKVVNWGWKEEERDLPVFVYRERLSVVRLRSEHLYSVASPAYDTNIEAHKCLSST